MRVSQRLYQAIFDLELEVRVRRGGERREEPPFPSLVQISFSHQPTAAVKIKNSSYTFHQENTECTLAKITPAVAGYYFLKCS